MPEGSWKDLFNAVPIPLMLVDSNTTVLMLNPAARDFLRTTETKRPFGDLFHCVRAVEKGCGQTEHCKDCPIRKSVRLALSGKTIVRQRVSQTKVMDGKSEKLELYITSSFFSLEGKALVLVAIEDITELTHLQKIIPICMNCKKIRNDENYWQAVDEYINRHYGLEFSHGLCPECARRLYPEFFDKDHNPGS
ncbi:MAG: PAS domain-containing protein [Nitrospirae bacterium]|nr:MAG: PAS domain-containing protein [Nitrospirota bacterium]